MGVASSSRMLLPLADHTCHPLLLGDFPHRRGPQEERDGVRRSRTEAVALEMPRGRADGKQRGRGDFRLTRRWIRKNSDGREVDAGGSEFSRIQLHFRPHHL